MNQIPAACRAAASAFATTPSRHVTGKTCAHCGGPQVGMADVDRQPLCHPDYGMDCYLLVTVYGHSMPCDCRGASDHPDNDYCYRCRQRRFEHLVDPAQPQRKDFLGNPVPCWDFLEYPVGARYVSESRSPRVERIPIE